VTPLLVQMSGAPGTGKSTLARAIAPQLHAAVLDHDLIKATLVEHMPLPAMVSAPATAGSGARPDQAAGRASYTLARRLAATLLDTGITVILDCPCFYTEQLEAGQQVAASHGAAYRYVECVTDNLDVIAARLRTRTAYPTQYRDMDQVPATAGTTTAAGAAGWQQWIDRMKRPADPSVYLRVDTSRPAGECAAGILRFLQADTVG
jgi:predicted kinase